MFLHPFNRPLALLLVLVACGCTREKDLLDEQVRKLCAVDGGITIHEKVNLSSSRFDEFGIVRVPAKSVARSGDDYYFEWDIKYYKKGNPEMWLEATDEVTEVLCIEVACKQATTKQRES